MRQFLWYNGRQTVLKHFHDSEYSLRPAAAEDLTFALSFGTGADANIICILITLPLAQVGAVFLNENESHCENDSHSGMCAKKTLIGVRVKKLILRSPVNSPVFWAN